MILVLMLLWKEFMIVVVLLEDVLLMMMMWFGLGFIVVMLVSRLESRCEWLKVMMMIVVVVGLNVVGVVVMFFF